MGPLLFLININDIVNSSNILSFVLFDNNITVYVQHESIDSEIQIIHSELAKVAEWLDSDKLTLIDVKKIRMLLLSRKKTLDPKVMSSYVCSNTKSNKGRIYRCNS